MFSIHFERKFIPHPKFSFNMEMYWNVHSLYEGKFFSLPNLSLNYGSVLKCELFVDLWANNCWLKACHIDMILCPNLTVWSIDFLSCPSNIIDLASTGCTLYTARSHMLLHISMDLIWFDWFDLIYSFFIQGNHFSGEQWSLSDPCVKDLLKCTSMHMGTNSFRLLAYDANWLFREVHYGYLKVVKISGKNITISQLPISYPFIRYGGACRQITQDALHESLLHHLVSNRLTIQGTENSSFSFPNLIIKFKLLLLSINFEISSL